MAKHAIRGASDWVDGSVEAVCQALHELYERVHGTAGFEDKRARRFKVGALPEWAIEVGRKITEGTCALQKPSRA